MDLGQFAALVHGLNRNANCQTYRVNSVLYFFIGPEFLRPSRPRDLSPPNKKARCQRAFPDFPTAYQLVSVLTVT